MTPSRGRCRLAAGGGCSRTAAGGWLPHGRRQEGAEPSRAARGSEVGPRRERGPLPVRRPAGLLGTAAGARRVVLAGCGRKRPRRCPHPAGNAGRHRAPGCCVSLFISSSDFLFVFIVLFLFRFALRAALIGVQPELALRARRTVDPRCRPAALCRAVPSAAPASCPAPPCFCSARVELPEAQGQRLYRVGAGGQTGFSK